MNKLYVFAIGGTGVRVIKALTFLLASGIKLRKKFEIVPIIVDPHLENENLKNTNQLLRLYENIREGIGESEHFFNTKIRTLKSLSENEHIPDTYSFRLGGKQHQKFKDFLNFDSLSEASKALVKTLFSDEHLNTLMDIGFVGNPHMGAVVLNKFNTSIEFQEFANNFNSGDRVFIISSIFGGTGASGFPIILKNIRRAADSEGLANRSFLENAPIGALSVQPYFSVDASSTSVIQKSDWIIKTKSALDYYQKAVTGKNGSVNAMYYLADTMSKSYKNDPGEGGQNNPAHPVEMIGALSLIDYANTEDVLLKTENGVPLEPYAKEFGVANNSRILKWTDFGHKTRSLLAKPLIRLFYTYKYLKESLEFNGSQAFMKRSPELNESFFKSAFFDTHLRSFFRFFENWLKEMELNERGFKPFNLNADLSEAIEGYSAERRFLKKNLSYVRFNDFLNDQSKEYADANSKLLEVLHNASDSILTHYFNSIN